MESIKAIHIVRVYIEEWGFSFWGVCIVRYNPIDGSFIVTDRLDGHANHRHAQLCAANWSQAYDLPILLKEVK